MGMLLIREAFSHSKAFEAVCTNWLFPGVLPAVLKKSRNELVRAAQVVARLICVSMFDRMEV